MIYFFDIMREIINNPLIKNKRRDELTDNKSTLKLRAFFRYNLINIDKNYCKQTKISSTKLFRRMGDSSECIVC